ncbi:hypothetical protein NP233_g472 [Leucocoprinus birnbaumii]|uniref:Extracellular membrane protein CFEM domain-containing protein n=1 Tax=Leucocoprinus birnbaumii TaxID=56174 RepID=A0AAD5W1R3_9AGAR|nr:hypothetical protein NP233_g472 [Leucocoprinus birnbaumii]
MVGYLDTLMLVVALFGTMVRGAVTLAEIHRAVARQTTPPKLTPDNIPPQCQSACFPLNALTDGTCSTFPCICGNDMGSNIRSCLQCLVDGGAAVGQNEVPQCQNIYQEYATACSTVGQISVPSFACSVRASISGGTSSSQPSASATTGSSTSSNTESSKSDNSNGNGGKDDSSKPNSGLKSSWSGFMLLSGVLASALALF